MFIVDFTIQLFIGIYLENILPSKSGYREPWNYFLKKSYWVKEMHSD